jgi:drug/metabolite transporter (DMT)-like permease
MPARTRKLALTEGVCAGILFGTAAIFIRNLQALDTFAIAFWRLVVACLALGAIMLLLRKPFSFGLVKKNARDFVVLGFFLGLHFIFFVSAVKDTTILNATVLVNTTPIFSMLVSSFVYKLKPSKVAVLGLAVSFAGIWIIALAETANAQQSTVGYSPSLKGDFEAVLAAMVEAVYLNYGRRVRKEMNLLSIMLPTYFLTALAVAAIGVPASRCILTLPTDMPAALALLGLGILPTAVAHSLYFSSLSNLKSFETATMALLEPIGATILGISLFQEVPAPLFAVGAILILCGVIFVIKNKE